MSIKCIVTNWEYMDSLCKKVADGIKEDNFEPEVVIALAKGGWFAGRKLSDLLGLDTLISLGIEHYYGISKIDEIRIDKISKSVEGKKILIVDDIALTGESIEVAYENVRWAGGEPKTAVLQLMYTSGFTPDYFGEYITEDIWMIFPWNFYEDMIDIIRKLMEVDPNEWTEWDVKQALYKEYSIDPVYLEIAQPGKLLEVLKEMERRKIIVQNKERESWRILDG